MPGDVELIPLCAGLSWLDGTFCKTTHHEFEWSIYKVNLADFMFLVRIKVNFLKHISSAGKQSNKVDSYKSIDKWCFTFNYREDFIFTFQWFCRLVNAEFLNTSRTGLVSITVREEKEKTRWMMCMLLIGIKSAVNE